MAVNVQTKDDNQIFTSAKFETFGNLVWVKATQSSRSFLIGKLLHEN